MYQFFICVNENNFLSKALQRPLFHEILVGKGRGLNYALNFTYRMEGGRGGVGRNEGCHEIVMR